jgi:hypothetical protein
VNGRPIIIAAAMTRTALKESITHFGVLNASNSGKIPAK